jgi:hypothetical protein
MNELEFVLGKIIDMDTRAKDVRTEAEQKLKDIEDFTNKRIRETEKIMLEISKKKLEETNNLKIQKADSEAKKIQKEADIVCNKIEDAYKKFSSDLINKITNEILNGSDER